MYLLPKTIVSSIQNDVILFLTIIFWNLSWEYQCSLHLYICFFALKCLKCYLLCYSILTTSKIKVLLVYKALQWSRLQISWKDLCLWLHLWFVDWNRSKLVNLKQPFPNNLYTKKIYFCWYPTSSYDKNMKVFGLFFVCKQIFRNSSRFYCRYGNKHE